MPKILICDDEKSIRSVLKTILESEGYEVVVATGGKEAIELFKKEPTSLIILDVSMPGMTGFEVMDKIRGYFGESYIPILFLTASIQIDDKLRALHSGAVDYLVKPVSPKELILRIQNFLEIKAKHDELKKEATFDWMTGALNRAHFVRKAKEELDKAVRNNFPLAFLLLDIDNFKNINDSKGHAAGDRVIREFAARIKKVIRNIDLFGRFGGDEFIIMLSHKTEKEAGRVAERLLGMLRKPIVFEKDRIQASASIGIAEKETTNTSPDLKKLIQLADQALYSAKSKGGDNFFPNRS